MSQATPQQDGVFPFYRPETDNCEFNATTFLIRSMLDQTNVATLVQVVAVNTGGPLSVAGTVDVRPLVNLVDGSGASWEHTTLYGLPFLRLQGGTNALVIDPEAGDIGIAIFCDHDISSVKANNKAALPASGRRFSMSDGVYLGGWGAAVAPHNAAILSNSGFKVTCSAEVDGNMNLVGGILEIDGVQVVRSQQPAIPPSTGTLGDTVRAVNAVINLLQTHGLTL
jgi:hypothetical protein